MNWGELKEAVLTYLEAGSADFITNLEDGLFCRLAEEDIYREIQLPMVRKTAWTNLIQGNRFLAIPSDWLATYSLNVLIANEYQFLLEKEPDFLKEAFPTGQEGIPRYYSIFDDTSLIVAPPPSGNYQVEMNYYCKPTSLSAGDDDGENWLSQNGENALLFGMLYHGYVFEKGDQDVITAYKEQFAKAIANLKTIAEGRNRKDTYRTPDGRIQT